MNRVHLFPVNIDVADCGMSSLKVDIFTCME
jgi:hypothetical protein